MKNSILILLLGLLPALLYSQSYTEKYNSLYDRYELYDSNNNLVSYKKYNSLYNRWEIYEVNKAVPTYQSLKPVDPTNWELAYQALAYKQQKFDDGKRYVDSQIQNLRNSISYSTTLSSDEKTQLQNSVVNAVNEINSQGKYDFSDDNVVNNILNYVYQCYNNTIKQINKQREKKNSKYSITMKDNFNKVLLVTQIKVYSKKSNKLVRTESIKENSYIILTENQIEFKRADGEVVFRNLVYKHYSDETYEYSSNWGEVHIDENLDYVWFFSPNEDEYYKYFIKH